MAVGDATGTGDVFFNAKLGRLEKSVLEATIPMTVTTAGPDGSPISLQSLAKSKTTIQLVEK